MGDVERERIRRGENKTKGSEEETSVRGNTEKRMARRLSCAREISYRAHAIGKGEWREREEGRE